MIMAFNLGEVLKDVSNLGTTREQIEYIDIDRIDDDPNNFYELSGIEELAANIELIGLQQPVRVRPNPDKPDRVVIVSGHRRRAAVRLLVEDGKESFREIPCIRERGEVSEAMQELRLIYANSDTRKLSSADLGKQAARVEELLYKLKEEGVEFPGRMRDHVAQACQVSKSKLARLKVIREGLTPYFASLYEKNKFSESVAYEIARMPKAHQAIIEAHQDLLKVSIASWGVSTAQTYKARLAEIDKLQCKGGGQCTNRRNKYMASIKRQTWESDRVCAKCCGDCEKLASCKYACPGLAGKIKKLKADKKAREEQERLAKEEKDAPAIAQIRAIWTRFAMARYAAGVSVKSYYNAVEQYWSEYFTEKTEAMEAPTAKFNPNSELPYGNMRLWEIQKLIRAADLFGCSADYLLCRTDVPQLDTVAMPEGWVPLLWIDGREKPQKAGQQAVAYFQDDKASFPWREMAQWNGTCWIAWGTEVEDKCVRWFPIPDHDEEVCG